MVTAGAMHERVTRPAARKCSPAGPTEALEVAREVRHVGGGGARELRHRVQALGGPVRGGVGASQGVAGGGETSSGCRAAAATGRERGWWWWWEGYTC